MTKTAVITGVDGQDGSYLAEILLGKGYRVWGLMRAGTHPPKNLTSKTLDNPNFYITKGDITSVDTVNQLFDVAPDEFYHLAALSHVGDSFKHPVLTMETNFIATQRILEKLVEQDETRFYFAGSSETLAKACAEHYWADHTKGFSARSPYAVSKMASQELVRVYRKAYHLYLVNGVAFNHESRRRGPNFVTRKLALGVREFTKTGKAVVMGNKQAHRDWHHAYDTMMGAWLSLQQPYAADYTFCSGTAMSVEQFAMAVCDHFGVDCGDAVAWAPQVEKRPWDVEYLKGNPFEAEVHLEWKREYDFKALVKDVCHVES